MSGLPARTIRYYEDIGLIRPDRHSNGYRDFSDNDVHKLQFLASARALGFSIDDCRSSLALWEDRDRASADVRRIARAHLDEIGTNLSELQAMRQTLAHLVDCCAGDAPPDCPILDGLADFTAPGTKRS